MESLEGEPSSYAHVFLEQPENPWPKLKNTFLSVFHAQYWGKDIREDKREWLETQNGGHRMDVDKAPANFALYFDIEGLNSNMWVREDYVLLYDHCTTYFNRPNVRSFSKPPSVIITGQSGIGK